MKDIKTYLRLLRNREVLANIISWKTIVMSHEAFYELLKDNPLKKSIITLEKIKAENNEEIDNILREFDPDAPILNQKDPFNQSSELSVGIIKYLLENEFNTLQKKYKDKKVRDIFITPINRFGKYKRGFSYTKEHFIRQIEEAYYNNLITEEEYQKSTILHKEVSYEKMLEENKDQTILFEDQEEKIPFMSFINLLSLPIEQIKEILEQDTIDGVEKEKYVYTLQNYFQQNGLLEKYIFPYEMLLKMQYIESKVDTFAYDRPLYKLPEYTDKINVNEDLWNEIWSKVPNEFTKLEKAYYIYYQLCKILTYDEEWYIFGGDVLENSEHNDITYLEMVNKEINEVVCYEFAAIYSQFLESLGARYEFGNGRSYAGGHEYLNFIVDKFFIKADSTEHLISGDFSLAKQNERLNDFKLKNTNPTTQMEFENSIKKVSEYIKKEEHQENDFLEIIRQYKALNSDSKCMLTNEEKLNILISSLEKCDLPPIDSLGYIHTTIKNLFPDDIGCVCKDFFIRDYNLPDTRQDKLGVVTVIYYKSSNLNKEQEKYFVFTPLVGIESTTKEEIEERIQKTRYWQISPDDPKIPGINYEGGDESVTKSTRSHK